jgi:ABC-type antimicrobial peptide transport system permease subunit
LQNSSLNGCDYIANTNETATYRGHGQALHDVGISQEDYSEIANFDGVTDVNGIMANMSTVLTYTDSDDMAKALKSSDIREQPSNDDYQCMLADIDSKQLEYMGYSTDEQVYSVPTVGINAERFSEFSQYVIDGSIDVDKINSGEEVVLFMTKDLSELFHVGDTIPLSDIVYSKEVDSQNVDYNLENYEPTFIETYSVDGEVCEYPVYCFGERKDITTKIGAIVLIDDVDDTELLAYYFQTGEYRSTDCSINILVTPQTFKAWELPDYKYTKVTVSLDDNANVQAFESVFYNALGNSQYMKYNSSQDIKSAMRENILANMSIFFSMIIVLVVIGSIGIYNRLAYSVRQQVPRIAMVTALGMPQRDSFRMLLSQNLSVILLGGIVSIVPVGVFQGIMNYVTWNINTGRNPEVYPSSIAVTPDTISLPWWYNLPIYYNLLEYHPIVTLLSVCVIFLVIIATIVYLQTNSLAKHSIVENIRRGDV